MLAQCGQKQDGCLLLLVRELHPILPKTYPIAWKDGRSGSANRLPLNDWFSTLLVRWMNENERHERYSTTLSTALNEREWTIWTGHFNERPNNRPVHGNERNFPSLLAVCICTLTTTAVLFRAPCSGGWLWLVSSAVDLRRARNEACGWLAIAVFLAKRKNACFHWLTGLRAVTAAPSTGSDWVTPKQWRWSSTSVPFEIRTSRLFTSRYR